jgi:hypothetical protein
MQLFIPLFFLYLFPPIITFSSSTGFGHQYSPTETRGFYYNHVSPVKTDPSYLDKSLKKLEKQGKKHVVNSLKSNQAKNDQLEKFLEASRNRKRK